MADAPDAATIRRVVAGLRDGTITYKRSHYTHVIEPLWLATPDRRWALWEVVAEIVRLDETYGQP